MEIVRQQVEKLFWKFQFLHCLEIGTIRSFTEKHESTRHILEAIGGNGDLLSVDIEPKHISIAKQITKNPPNVFWVQSDSLSFLADHNKNYEFILLDGVNDMHYVFEEFKLCYPLLVSGGIIMVDDCGVDQSGKWTSGPKKKGRLVHKYCQDNKINFEIVNSSNGFQLIVYK